MNVTHPIAEKYGPHLLPRTGYGTERLAGLLNVGLEQLDAHKEAVLKAAHVNQDLKDSARRREQHKITNESRKARADRMEKALQQYRGELETKKANLRAKTSPKQPDSSIEKLHDLLLAQEIRQELRQMKSDERVSHIRESVKNGDRTLLDAVKGPIKPMISPDLIDGFEEAYQRAVAQEELNQVEVEADLIDQAEAVIKNFERHLSYLEQQEDRLLDPPDTKIDLSGWSANDKAKFIKENGADAWQKVLAGEAAPEDFKEAV